MKYYKVLDKQGANFMDWTHDEPQTKQSIRAYLYSMSNDGKTSLDDMWIWKDYKLDDALSDYDIELELVKER